MVELAGTVLQVTKSVLYERYDMTAQKLLIRTLKCESVTMRYASYINGKM